jgi:hypothetical protein
MTTAAECHQFAKESLAAAEVAASEEQRQAFLQLARTWTLAAARLEGVLVPHAELPSRKEDGSPQKADIRGRTPKV